MAAKSASVARELKSVKSDMSFLQERCALLEEENQRLRDGFGKGVRPDDDDLVNYKLLVFCCQILVFLMEGMKCVVSCVIGETSIRGTTCREIKTSN